MGFFIARRSKNMKMNTRKLTGIAMLSAISICSLYLIRFSIFPAIAFMEYDVADVFIFLGTFMYGPISGLIMTLVVSLYQAFLMGGNGLTGALMHFLATGTFCLVSGFTTKQPAFIVSCKSFKTVIIAPFL
jgi:riboflavin transporter FmnP